MNMIKVIETEKHDFYRSKDRVRNKRVYNIVPRGASAPEGGYFCERLILSTKGYSEKSFTEVLKNSSPFPL